MKIILLIVLTILSADRLHAKTNDSSVSNGLRFEIAEKAQCKEDGEACGSFLECCSHICIDIVNRCISFADFQKVKGISQEVVKTDKPIEVKEKKEEKLVSTNIQAPCNTVYCNGIPFTLYCPNGVCPHNCFTPDNCHSVTCYC